MGISRLLTLGFQEIDHETIANTAFKTKLKKDKKLSGNDDLQTAVAKELVNLVAPASPGSNLAKVQGRLLSSKVLASEVAAAVEAVEAVLFPETKKLKSPNDLVEEEDNDVESESERPIKKAKVMAAEESSEDGGEGDEEEGSERVDLSDAEGDSEDGWESGTVDGGPDESSDDASSDEEGSDEDEDEDTQTEKTAKPRVVKQEAQKVSAKKMKADSQPKKSAGESTFLPSLAVGFTHGDSDASDVDDDVADVGPKKNRRGQRARRAYVFKPISPRHHGLTRLFSIQYMGKEIRQKCESRRETANDRPISS